MIKKQWFLTILLSVISVYASSQVEENLEPEKQKQEMSARFIDRVVFSADIGLSFGSITYIKLAPVVGYRVTSRFIAGLGPIYIYEKYKDFNLETSTYGGKAVLSYTLVRGTDSGGKLRIGNILLHMENEVVNVEGYRYDYATQRYYFDKRLWIDNLLAGFGLNQPLGGRFGVSMYILWDVTQNKYSPYTNPIFKFGLDF